MNTPWRCLHVRRRFERLVALRLEKKGFETFVPFCPIQDRSPNGQPRIGVPLLPGYVFFRCDFAEQTSICAIPGVLAIVRSVESISMVRTHEIQDLQRVVNSGIPCQRWPVTSGNLETIEDGPLRGLSGVPVNTTGKRRLILPISLVCRSVAIEILDGWNLSQREQANSTSSNG